MSKKKSYPRLGKEPKVRVKKVKSCRTKVKRGHYEKDHVAVIAATGLFQDLGLIQEILPKKLKIMGKKRG